MKTDEISSSMFIHVAKAINLRNQNRNWNFWNAVPSYSRAGVQLGHNRRRRPWEECGLDSEKSDGATPHCRARNDSFVYVCRNGYHIRFFQFSLPRAARLRGRQRTALKLILYVVALRVATRLKKGNLNCPSR
ncbi:hypothetical protein ElyMa_000704200 [Elysia marginata]|uniref:SRCR domain-containing protein n=1 Tax=Elysia marginata TaxID=1093978 RepID=A0AAV4GLB7_9GAST|nr:hypothetical protein ElyMa_000704200 [Elysia marginata]